jgi:hypothetical protein
VTGCLPVTAAPTVSDVGCGQRGFPFYVGGQQCCTACTPPATDVFAAFCAVAVALIHSVGPKNPTLPASLWRAVLCCAPDAKKLEKHAKKHAAAAAVLADTAMAVAASASAASGAADEDS